MISGFDAFLDSVLILLFWLFWHLLWQWMVLEMGREKFEGLLIVSVLQAAITVLLYLADINLYRIGNDEVEPNTLIEKVHMIVSVGFYLHDTPHWKPSLTLSNVTMLFHHLLSLTVLIMVLLHGYCGAFLLEFAVLFELPTPLLLVRHYQKEAGYNTRATDLSYFFFFVLLRFWFGANLTLLIVLNEDVPSILKFMCFFIFITSLCLLPGVIRMALFKRHTHSSSRPSRSRTRAKRRSRSRTPSPYKRKKTVPARDRCRAIRR